MYCVLLCYTLSSDLRWVLFVNTFVFIFVMFRFALGSAVFAVGLYFVCCLLIAFCFVDCCVCRCDCPRIRIAVSLFTALDPHCGELVRCALEPVSVSVRLICPRIRFVAVSILFVDCILFRLLRMPL